MELKVDSARMEAFGAVEKSDDKLLIALRALCRHDNRNSELEYRVLLALERIFQLGAEHLELSMEKLHIVTKIQ